MLTDTKCRNAKAGTKGYRLPDAGGLHLFVTPTGAKSWRLRYKVAGAEQTLVIGPYPAITLAMARTERDKAKAALVQGSSPKAIKAVVDHSQGTLRAVGERWHAKNIERWNPAHAVAILSRLEQDVFRYRTPAGPRKELGALSIGEVTPAMLLPALRAIEARNALSVAHRTRSALEHVFAFGAAEGICENNPAAVIAKAMAPHLNRGHRRAATTIEAARDVLTFIEAQSAYPVVRLAFRLLVLTALRPGEVCGGLWEELSDLDGPEPTWIVGAHRMKMGIEHGTPLSRQAIESINVLRQITGHRRFMFPSPMNPDQPLGVDALSKRMRDNGIAQDPHGWRASFSTIMNEHFPADRHVIDLMLAHKPKDAVERAYNRALHMPRRRELAQIWADMMMDGMPAPDGLLALPIK